MWSPSTRQLPYTIMKVIYPYHFCGKIAIIGVQNLLRKRPKKAPQDPNCPSHDLTQGETKKFNVTTMTNYTAASLTF
jgi:hypothetical protein